MELSLSCYDCGRRVAVAGDAALSTARCDCGEPLWIDPATPESWDPAADADSTPGDRMWAFGPSLPVGSPGGLADAVGGTPLFRAPTLDGYAGCRVTVKDESAHPTGSFKDRGTAVGVAAAAAAGAPAVGTVSHGNMAISTAAFAAAADLPCVVLVPADIPGDRLANIARFDPAIRRIEGDYGRLYYEALAAGRELGVPFVNSDVPLRVAGQKTTGLELLAARAPGFPEAVVMPVSSGGHAGGVWKALRELSAAGYEDLPDLYLVQAAACDPIARADRTGADGVSPVDAGETVAYSIANADPPSGRRALRAARATGGRVLSVDDDAIRAARAELATAAGINVEPACATTLAAARELTAAGDLAADDEAVLVATGSGYKERGDVGVEAPSAPLDGLAGALRDAIGTGG